MAVGIDYRQLQAPDQVRTDLPDPGAAAKAAALGGLFKEFEGVAGEQYEKFRTQAGALAGAAAGATGHPQYKQGLNRFSAYSTAFNNAATGAYAIQAEAQADDAAARLRVEANNDPDHFRATYSAVRDAVLKNAPAQAVPMLTELYNKHLAAGLAAISGDQAAERQRLQRATYDEGIARQTSRVAILQGSMNPQDQLAAMDEQVKLTLQINGGVNAGLYSAAEAEAMHINAARAITSQVFSTQIDRELSKPPETRDVVGIMERFRQLHNADLADTTKPPTLSEAEYQKLFADATTKIREQNLLEAYNRREGKTAEQLRFEAGDTQYTSMLLAGKLTDRALNAAVLSGDLKPERATSLHSLMLQGPAVAKSDPVALRDLHTDPNFLDMTIEDLTKMPGINPHDQLAAWGEIQKRKNGWEGTQASKQAIETIAVALKIPPGTPTAAMSVTERKAYADAHEEYVNIVNGLKPSEQQQGGALRAAAATAIQHAQQKVAREEVQTLMRLRDSAIRTHGPGKDEPWDPEKLQKYLEEKDKDIAAASARAKGTP